MQIRIYELESNLTIKLVYQRGVQGLPPKPSTSYGLSADDVIGFLHIVYHYCMCSELVHWRIYFLATWWSTIVFSSFFELFFGGGGGCTVAYYVSRPLARSDLGLSQTGGQCGKASHCSMTWQKSSFSRAFGALASSNNRGYNILLCT